MPRVVSHDIIREITVSVRKAIRLQADNPHTRTPIQEEVTDCPRINHNTGTLIDVLLRELCEFLSNRNELLKCSPLHSIHGTDRFKALTMREEITLVRTSGSTDQHRDPNRLGRSSSSWRCSDSVDVPIPLGVDEVVREFFSCSNPHFSVGVVERSDERVQGAVEHLLTCVHRSALCVCGHVGSERIDVVAYTKVEQFQASTGPCAVENLSDLFCVEVVPVHQGRSEVGVLAEAAHVFEHRDSPGTTLFCRRDYRSVVDEAKENVSAAVDQSVGGFDLLWRIKPGVDRHRAEHAVTSDGLAAHQERVGVRDDERNIERDHVSEMAGLCYMSSSDTRQVSGFPMPRVVSHDIIGELAVSVREAIRLETNNPHTGTPIQEEVTDCPRINHNIGTLIDVLLGELCEFLSNGNELLKCSPLHSAHGTDRFKTLTMREEIALVRTSGSTDQHRNPNRLSSSCGEGRGGAVEGASPHGSGERNEFWGNANDELVHTLSRSDHHRRGPADWGVELRAVTRRPLQQRLIVEFLQLSRECCSVNRSCPLSGDLDHLRDHVTANSNTIGGRRS